MDMEEIQDTEQSMDTDIGYVLKWKWKKFTTPNSQSVRGYRHRICTEMDMEEIHDTKQSISQGIQTSDMY